MVFAVNQKDFKRFSALFYFCRRKRYRSRAEIWSSYGDDYDYDSFMKLPEVRDFFCGLLKIDCREEFTYAN